MVVKRIERRSPSEGGTRLVSGSDRSRSSRSRRSSSRSRSRTTADKSKTVIRNPDGSTTTIIRSKDPLVGTIQVRTPAGSDESEIISGGGSNRERNIRELEKQGISVRKSEISTRKQQTSPQLAVRTSQPTPSEKSTRVLRDDRLSSPVGEPSPFVRQTGDTPVASAEEGGVITRQQADELQRRFNEPVASAERGGVITRGQAEQIQRAKQEQIALEERRTRGPRTQGPFITEQGRTLTEERLFLAGFGLAQEQPVATSIIGEEVPLRQAQLTQARKIAQEAFRREIVEPAEARGQKFREPDDKDFQLALEIFTKQNIAQGSLQEDEIDITPKEFEAIQTVIKSPEFAISKQEQSKEATTIALTEVAVAGGLAIPIVAGLTLATAVGVGTGVAAAEIVGGISTKIKEDDLQFFTDNPEIGDIAIQTSRAKAQEESGLISGFLGLDVFTVPKEVQVEAGVQELVSRGVSGVQLQEAERALEAQVEIERSATGAFLLGAEALGEFNILGKPLKEAGESIFTFGAKRLGKEVVEDVPDFTTQVSRLLAADTSQLSRRELVERTAVRGSAEASFFVAASQQFETGEINPVDIGLASVGGALTAGGFELLRTGTGTTTLGRFGTETVGNIVEPQELIVDTLLNVQESAVRKVGRVTKPKRLDIDEGFIVTRKGVNEFDIQPRTPDASVTQLKPFRSPKTTRTTTLDIGLAEQTGIIGRGTQDLGFTPAQLPSQSNQFSRIIDQTKQKTDDQTIIQTKEFVQTNVFSETFTDTFSKSFAKTSAFTQTKSRARTKTLTPPVFIPPLPIGGFGSGVRPPKRKGRGRRKTTETVFEQFFSPKQLQIRGITGGLRLF